MAQKVQVLLVDDVDGGEAAETGDVRIGRTSYEIDLSVSNAQRCATRSPPGWATRDGWAAAARRGPVPAVPGSSGAAATGPDLTAVRAWARENGYQVRRPGRSPARYWPPTKRPTGGAGDRRVGRGSGAAGTPSGGEWRDGGQPIPVGGCPPSLCLPVRGYPVPGRAGPALRDDRRQARIESGPGTGGAGFGDAAGLRGASIRFRDGAGRLPGSPRHRLTSVPGRAGVRLPGSPVPCAISPAPRSRSGPGTDGTAGFRLFRR